MQEPTKQQLHDSIEELKAYKDRLTKEVLRISQKLQMPKSKIEKTIADHSELNSVVTILEKLTKQMNKKH